MNAHIVTNTNVPPIGTIEIIYKRKLLINATRPVVTCRQRYCARCTALCIIDNRMSKIISDSATATRAARPRVAARVSGPLLLSSYCTV
jgi:hypothetical protein